MANHEHARAMRQIEVEVLLGPGEYLIVPISTGCKVRDFLVVGGGGSSHSRLCCVVIVFFDVLEVSLSLGVVVGPR